MSTWWTHYALLLQLLRLAGLLPATYCAETHRLIATSAQRRRSTLINAFILLGVSLLYVGVVLLAFVDPLQMYNSNLGNSLLLFQLLFAALLLFGQMLVLCFQSSHHITLHNSILMLSLNYKLNAKDEGKLQHYFAAQLRRLLLIALIYIINLLLGLRKANVSLPVLLTIFFILSLHLVIASILLCCFVCVMNVIQLYLAAFNERLTKMVVRGDAKQLLLLLNVRAKLLLDCTTHLTPVYGITLLFESLHVLVQFLALPMIFVFLFVYWSNVEFYQACDIVLKVSIGSMSPFVFYAQALLSQKLTMEANKTAKILAKIPRTGSGLDKMVEKFLLKNLRQQPILTAYGFFALDKSTLFKLFTAIFTYMVILVQFKEMENSTRSMQTNNSKNN